MKRTLLALAMTLVSAAAVPVLYAQSAASTFVVPFGFEARGKQLEPGTYSLYRVTSNALRMSKRGGGSIILTMPAVAETRNLEHSRLVFHRYGDEYFLSQVWDSDAQRVVSYPTSTHERELAAASEGKPSNVSLAAAR